MVRFALARKETVVMARSVRLKRATRGLTTLDDFLKEEGKLEEFEFVAIKEVLAWQIAEAMKAQNFSRKGLA
jgi:antitoxin HicB